MDWTPEHAALAAAEGWRLVTTFDNGSTRPLTEIARRTDQTPFANDKAAGAHVVNAARMGGQLHRHALTMIARAAMKK